MIAVAELATGLPLPKHRLGGADVERTTVGVLTVQGPQRPAYQLDAFDIEQDRWYRELVRYIGAVDVPGYGHVHIRLVAVGTDTADDYIDCSVTTLAAHETERRQLGVQLRHVCGIECVDRIGTQRCNGRRCVLQTCFAHLGRDHDFFDLRGCLACQQECYRKQDPAKYGFQISRRRNYLT